MPEFSSVPISLPTLLRPCLLVVLAFHIKFVQCGWPVVCSIIPLTLHHSPPPWPGCSHPWTTEEENSRDVEQLRQQPQQVAFKGPISYVTDSHMTHQPQWDLCLYFSCYKWAWPFTRDGDELNMEMRRKFCPGRDGPEGSREMSVIVFLVILPECRKKKKRKKKPDSFAECSFFWKGQGQQIFSGAAVLLVCSKTIPLFNSFVLLPGINECICSVLKMFQKPWADFADIPLPLNPLQALKLLNPAAAPSHTYHFQFNLWSSDLSLQLLISFFILMFWSSQLTVFEQSTDMDQWNG